MSFNFSLATLPKIEFGRGVFNQLPAIISRFGKRILLITGQRSFKDSVHWENLTQSLIDKGMSWEQVGVNQEPSPALVDSTVAAFKHHPIDVVVGIGGGSALDAAKAIAGLLKVQTSVMDFLEGVGPELAYQGPAVPFIAVPTTAGTGSEATKNAVLSVQGTHGFKKSFRDEKLVADYAVVDPELLSTCPSAVIAANGMDALTQLLESYVSIKSNAFSDALALSGIRAARDALLPLYQQASEDMPLLREKMAYAALCSGITLAQVGLGSVHGLASPLGAYFPIPHGVVCGTLVATATQINIKAMIAREPDNPALAKYAEVGHVLCNTQHVSDQLAWDALVELLGDWTTQLQLPRLSAYCVDKDALALIVKNARGSSMKTNPIVLTDSEIRATLLDRL